MLNCLNTSWLAAMQKVACAGLPEHKLAGCHAQLCMQQTARTQVGWLPCQGLTRLVHKMGRQQALEKNFLWCSTLVCSQGDDWSV